MLKNKTRRDTHWTIDHIPDHGNKPFRLRWKKLKSLGNSNDSDLRKNHYFATLALAKDFATKKIEDIQRIGKLAGELEPEKRALVLREAARLVERGIDPIEAMEEGARHLKAYGDQANIEIGTFWPAYVEQKKDSGKWGARNLKAQETFFEVTKEIFMRKPIREFIYATSGKEIVKSALETYRKGGARNATNTVRGAKSKMRAFLGFVANRVHALKSSTIKEIFEDEYILPLRTRKEAKNVAINADQAKYLISYMAERKLAGWIVFKLFMGARTLLLQQWRWSVVDWERGMIRIPENQTKLKKGEIRFPISDIPNFSTWLKWALEIDGSPKPEQPICRFSQPTITNHVKKAMNAKKGLFVSDKRKTIRPEDDFRNFMRSGFITYGIEKMGIGRVVRIAEDKHNLDKYLANDSATSGTSEAEKFWSIKPEAITLNPLPPPPARKRRKNQTAKTALTR